MTPPVHEREATEVREMGEKKVKVVLTVELEGRGLEALREALRKCNGIVVMSIADIDRVGKIVNVKEVVKK